MNGAALAEHIDPAVSCARCPAVCCRQRVLLMAEDEPPRRYTTTGADGLRTMRRDADGWCAALDRELMCCSIHPERPRVCRDLPAGGAECRRERAEWLRTR